MEETISSKSAPYTICSQKKLASDGLVSAVVMLGAAEYQKLLAIFTSEAMALRLIQALKLTGRVPMAIESLDRMREILQDFTTNRGCGHVVIDLKSDGYTDPHGRFVPIAEFAADIESAMA